MIKTALITGSAQRIGGEIAESLASQGWNIALHYNNSESEVLKKSKKISSYGVKVISIKADLSDELQAKEIISKVNDEIGSLSCLINNAAVFKNDSVLENTKSNWQQHIDVNLRAPMILSESFAKQLPDNTDGNIINLLDYCVWRLPENFTSYTLSKTGLWTLTQIMALQLAPKIRVNGIGPGNTLLNPKEPEDHFIQARSRTPLKTGGSVEEVCRVVDFFINMPSVTGQMIALDGGKHLMTPGFY